MLATSFKKNRVIINGARGQLGQVAVKAVHTDQTLTLVAELGRGDNLRQAILDTQADIVLELTQADVVFSHAQCIIDSGARPIIGASGLNDEAIATLQIQCRQAKLGGLIVPNFSLAMLLMMNYAKDAARYFSNIEIIEMHHEKKKDAPSGTAYQTANLMAANLMPINRGSQPLPLESLEVISGCRGGKHHGIPIHSIRLPGLLAHQMVIFGHEGETLTLRADTLSRDSYQQGILLACQQVMTLNELVVGLNLGLEK